MPATSRGPRPRGFRHSLLPLLKRLLQFNMVGWVGTLVNMGVLFVLHGLLDWPLVIAGALAVELAIVHNFTWHRLWTWRHRDATRDTGFFRHLVQYNLATGAIDLTVHLSILWGLATVAGVHYLLANLAGMIVGPLIKFWVNERLIFRKKRTTNSMESV